MLTSQRQSLEGGSPLKASDVHVSYVKGDEVLKGVDLVLHTGELILVRGVSGSGKTTLLNVLSGLLSPLRGTVCINGVDITKISESRRDAIRLHEMGMVFQHHGLVPDFTSRENIELVLRAREIKNSAAIAMDALKEVGSLNWQIDALLRCLGSGSAGGDRPCDCWRSSNRARR